MAKPTIRQISSLSLADRAMRAGNRKRLGDVGQSCISCKKPVWISCFFDGTGNNFRNDGAGEIIESDVSYSNVSKLWYFAHPENDITNRTYSLYIEGVGTPCPKVGDSGDGIDKATGMSLASKGAARINWMLENLTARINSHMPAVSQINVAVFGFSRGAAQARAFVRLLEDRCKRQGDELHWVGSRGGPDYPRMVVYFLGIFDTVASVGFGGSRLEKALSNAVASSLPVFGPPGVLASHAVKAADGGGHSAWASDLQGDFLPGSPLRRRRRIPRWGTGGAFQ